MKLIPGVLAIIALSGLARADELTGRCLARPIGGFAPAGRVGGREPRGPVIGVESGLGVTVATGGRSAEDAWTFGVRVGYQARSGISVFARYDDLGVRPVPSNDARLQAATFGVRYAIPFLVPIPFLEVMAGTAFGAADPVKPAGAAGLGLSLPIDRASIDLSARDWLVSLDGSLRQTLTFQAGVSVVF